MLRAGGCGAGGSSPCSGSGGKGWEDGGGASAQLGGDEARVGRVRMGPAELQRDRGAGRAAEAARDLVERPGGHVDSVNGHEHVLLREWGGDLTKKRGMGRRAESRQYSH